jgi:hypothetical protein
MNYEKDLHSGYVVCFFGRLRPSWLGYESTTCNKSNSQWNCCANCFSHSTISFNRNSYSDGKPAPKSIPGYTAFPG